MERFISPAQVAEQLNISRRRAYDIMNSIPHIAHPLRVSERALKDWIEKNTVYPMPKRQTRRTA